MNTTNNTVLITGGSAGIGFELAALFAEKGNKVIITGRDEQRLTAAVHRLKNATGILSDVADPVQVDNLVATINKDFPDLNIVIDHAFDRIYDRKADADSFTDLVTKKPTVKKPFQWRWQKGYYGLGGESDLHWCATLLRTSAILSACWSRPKCASEYCLAERPISNRSSGSESSLLSESYQSFSDWALK